MRRVLVYFFVVMISILLVPLAETIPKLYAQNSNTSGIAVYIPIVGGKVEEGDIVTLSKNGYVLGEIPYDPNIFGVVVNDPALAFENTKPGSYPVVSAGKVLMRVSAINGNIKKGDMLTTSSVAGVGQKATDTGFIVATALADYDSAEKPGKIFVVLNVGHGNVNSNSTGSLLKAFQFVMNAPYMSPLAVLRYVISGIIVLTSFVLAVGYFGRLSSLGIEALGRNPLAGKVIIVGIVINVIIALSIIFLGILIGYLVLVI